MNMNKFFADGHHLAVLGLIWVGAYIITGISWYGVLALFTLLSWQGVLILISVQKLQESVDKLTSADK